MDCQLGIWMQNLDPTETRWGILTKAQECALIGKTISRGKDVRICGYDIIKKGELYV